jgi:hypothetical protein
MFSRTWQVEAAGHRLRLVHDCDLLLRTRIRLRVDEELLARTPWRLNLAAIVIRATLPDGRPVEASVAYGLNGYSRVHRILVDGRLASGSAEVDDYYAKNFPEDRHPAAHLARGALAGVIYGALMLAFGQFSLDQPRSSLVGTAIFAVLMAAGDWWITRRAADDRRFYADDGS